MNQVFEAIAKDGVIVLPEGVPSTMRCLVAILDDGLDELRQQAAFMLPESLQQRMSELLERNRRNELTDEQRDELDGLGREFDAATLKRARACAILSQLESQANAS